VPWKSIQKACLIRPSGLKRVGEEVKLSKLEFLDQVGLNGVGEEDKLSELEFESEKQVLLLLKDFQIRNILTG